MKESVAKFGRLVPIIKDAHGNIIDGLHRKEIDPKWDEEFSIKLDNITGPVQLLLARMNVNLCRRSISAEEKTAWLKELKRLTNWSTDEIAENTGMSKRWVLQYMPKELKEPEPDELSRARLAREKMPETPKEPQIKKIEQPVMVKCSCCPLGTYTPKVWQGKPVCPDCYAKLELGKITLKPTVEKPMPEEPKVYRPKETAEHRRAVMTPAISKMDEAVYEALMKNEALADAGWTFEFQKRYCIKEVRSDVTATKGSAEKPLFIDGPVHVGREDRDEANRELLARRLGIPEVYAFDYQGEYSDEKRDEIVAKISAVLIDSGDV